MENGKQQERNSDNREGILQLKHPTNLAPNLALEEPGQSSDEVFISELSVSEKLQKSNRNQLPSRSPTKSPVPNKKGRKRKVIATKTKVFRQINFPFKNIYKKDSKLSIQVVDKIEPRSDLNRNHVGFQMRSLNLFSSDLEHSNSTAQRLDHNWVEIGINSLKTKMEKKKKKKIGKRRRRKVRCNCKNSYCIKLYCECFRKNGYCGKHCTCLNCKNVPSNAERQKISEAKSGNKQNSFVFKFNSEKGKGIEIIYKGCNCVRSRCNNGYCECFANGSKCQPGCFCRNCQNV